MGRSTRSQPAHQYTLIEESSQRGGSWADCVSSSRRASFRYPSCSTLVYWIILAGVAGVSFLLGKHDALDNSGANIQLDTVSLVFKYNRTFGEVSSNETIRAWEELFPEQGGFFRHPTIAPKRSAFSVFHQLHCLNGIRQGYWTLHEAALEGRKMTDEEMPMMSSPPHIRHCIDLLRRALMCQPDTTVEVKDEAIGGVKGFGTEHQCKDWDQLVDWTRKWESYRQDEE